MATFIDASGTRNELPLQPQIYREALKMGISVPQYLNRKHPTSDAKLSTFEQLCVSAGLIVNKNSEFGLKPPTLAALLEGGAVMSGAANVLDADPASRTLYPAVILEMVESALQVDRQTDPTLFDEMVGMDSSITSNRYEWPVVNLARAETARARAITQLAEPTMMMTITSADSSKSLMTTSLGLEVSDQALQATTLDFVAMAIKRQGEVERNTQTYEYLLAMLNGDTDMGTSALAQTKADTYDSAIIAAGAVTETALVAWMVHNWSQRRLDWVVTDLAGYSALKTALLTTNTNQHVPGSLVPTFEVRNRMLSKLNLFITDPGQSWPANTLMGFDSRYAIHRVRNTAASYSAVEEFVMRRSKQLRIDSSEIAYRFFDDAFDTLSLTLSGT